MSQLRHGGIDPLEIEAQTGTSYPEPYRENVVARRKRVLGDAFGLSRYGVNLVELSPGTWSSQRHWHTHEDEFVFVVSGELTLITDAGEQILTPGMVALLRARLPARALHELLVTGVRMGGDRAAREGVVDEAVSSERVVGRAVEIAAAGAERDSATLSALKRGLYVDALAVLEGA